MRQSLEKLKKNTQKLLILSPKDKKFIILRIAEALRGRKGEILSANEKDLAAFSKGEALRDRLLLDSKRFDALCASLEQIAHLDDPVGKVLAGWVNEAGLKIEKVSVPLGVVCVIYEARPAISAELVALLLKSSNGGVLKGGSEAKNTNLAIFECVQDTLKGYGLEHCFLMLNDRATLNELLQMSEFIDLVVPRGSSAMINEIASKSKIPLIKHDKGLCHTFVDESADLKDAVSIIINAKCQRPSACNALESLLVHKNIAKELFALLIPEFTKNGVKIYADEPSLALLKGAKLQMQAASEQDYLTEWLDLALCVKIVKDTCQAIEHINAYGSAHSDAILSNNAENIALFQRQVNSACVYVNASTRFSDGGEFGFGAEVGISTSKLHARGPMGVKELCTYKYLVSGAGQVRS